MALSHDYISSLLVHISLHGRDSEVSGMCLLSKPINLSLSVDDDCLGDGEGFVQATQCVQLPLLSFHIDVELVNTPLSQLFLLENNLNGVPHEPQAHWKHCSLQQYQLCVVVELLEYVIDLVLETMA